MTDSERLQVSQWILERNLHWIGAAEVKTGVIVAIDTAMLGGLAAAFSAVAPAERTAWATLFTIISAGCLGVALLCTAMSILPRVTGPESSFIFFGKIVKRTTAEYADAFRKMT
ncbi:MAG: DUF5706 domain-containing protein, partial [Gammaproteobacteria bacterium]|nr:DUF5706 domain-containing protein [Gammaproteobacteria bacterium]